MTQDQFDKAQINNRQKRTASTEVMEINTLLNSKFETKEFIELLKDTSEKLAEYKQKAFERLDNELRDI